MKRRILSLLLALCMVVGLLPMIALAEDTTEETTEETTEVKTATLTINTAGPHTASEQRVYWTPTLEIGMDPIYRLTTEDGAIATGATADNYNLKVEWPSDVAYPTLTMKNANLVNDNVNTSTYTGSVYHTIVIGGTADFVIALEGTNTIVDGWLASTGAAVHRVPDTIVAKNTGTLTIKGSSKADSLSINNSSGSCIEKYYNALTIEDATVSLTLNKTYQAYQVGIAMLYGGEGYEDLTNLTVRNSNLTIKDTSGYHTIRAILLTENDPAVAYMGDTYVDKNTGDILFENSNINIDVQASTGQVTDSNEVINFGANSTCTIKNCDAYIHARHITFSYVPTITNATATLKTEKSTDVVAFPNDDLSAGDSLVGTNTEPIYSNIVTVTHSACVAGDPVEEAVRTNYCTWTNYQATYCVVCDKELSRETLETTVIHTPGKKTELTEQRVDASITLGDSTGSGWSVNPGKYIFEYTCTICGDTLTEEKTFQPAILDYLPLDEEGEETRVYNFSTQWANNYKSQYTPRLVITAGETYYFTTESGHATFEENKYVTPLTDETKIASGAWNIKLEYPLYGDPILTLKGAEIINGFGLWYGIYGYTDLAPLTVIVDGTTKIEHTGDSYTKAGLLNFRTVNPVTIIGKNDGTLDLDSRATATALRSLGDLTISDVIIDVAKADISSFTTSVPPAVIQSVEGNITINNCDIDLNATAVKGVSGVGKGIYALETLTVNDSDIFALANVSGTGSGILHAADIVINESTLQLAFAYLYSATATGNRYGDAINYTNTITFNYANGFTAHSQDSRTTYNPDADPTWSAPSSLTTITSVSKLTKTVLNYYYFDIAPDTALIDFAGSAVTVEDDLTLEFAIPAVDSIPAGSIAYITRNGETTTITLGNDYLEEGYWVIPCVGIAAKEMHDEVTVVIKSADGATTLSETRTDSVYDYLVRMLASEQGTMSDNQYAALKTVLVEMLNYGTMAQVLFNHNTDNLANTVLTPNDWECATQNFTAPEATAATAVQEEGVTTSTHLGTTFELNTNIAMLMAVDTTDLGTGSYAEVYIDGELEETVNAEDYEGYAVYTFNGMVAADGEKDITFKFYNAAVAAEDETQEAIASELKLTVTDSLAGYVGRNISKYPYLANLMKYCNAAAAYFNA